MLLTDCMHIRLRETVLGLQRAMGQDHIYRCLVGDIEDQHGAVCDAMKSMHLYHLYKHLEKDVEEHRRALVSLLPAKNTPPSPPADRHKW